MSRNLLLQSIQGHLALLAEKHPKKAATPVARRMKLSIENEMRQPKAIMPAAPLRKAA